MQISAGRLRGRKIEIVEQDSTRQTLSRIRINLFNLLGQVFFGGNCLDLFAGSGILGLEAYSRGIDKVYANDINPEVFKILKSNFEKLGIESNLFNLDYLELLHRLVDRNMKFDLIILDPPYHREYLLISLEFIDKNELLSKDGLLAVETSRDIELADNYRNFKLIKQRDYASTRLGIYTSIK